MSRPFKTYKDMERKTITIHEVVTNSTGGIISDRTHTFECIYAVILKPSTAANTTPTFWFVDNQAQSGFSSATVTKTNYTSSLSHYPLGNEDNFKEFWDDKIGTDGNLLQFRYCQKSPYNVFVTGTLLTITIEEGVERVFIDNNVFDYSPKVKVEGGIHIYERIPPTTSYNEASIPPTLDYIPPRVIYHDFYIEGTDKPSIYLHTHHNIENAIVQSYISYSVASKPLSGDDTVWQVGRGVQEFEYLGHVNYLEGLLNEKTWQNLLDSGYENKGIQNNILQKLIYEEPAVRFRDFIIKDDRESLNSEQWAIIRKDGTHTLVDNVVEEVKSDEIIIRFFVGKPPQEIEDSTHEGGEDEKNYDGTETEKMKDEDTTTTDEFPDGELVGSGGIFHDMFKVSDINMKNLRDKIWSQDFFNILKVNENPIDNIVSCKRFPFDISTTASQNIVIGNIDTGVVGGKINGTVKLIDMGDVYVRPKYNNFLDYYKTNVSIYLPFIGITPLDTHSVMGKHIHIDYIVDMVSGVCKARLHVNNNVIMERDGQMGIDCTLSASTQKQSEIANSMRLVNGASQIVGGAMSGNVGAIGSGIEGIMSNGANNNYQSTSTNATISTSSKMQCYLIYDRPCVLTSTDTSGYPIDYAKTVGIPSGITKTLSSLSGYVKCGQHIRFSKKLTATKDEQDMIKNLLREGVEV